MICELCKINSGRINANLRCCMVRGLAESPEHIRKAHYDTLEADELQVLRDEVKAERKRLREMKQDHEKQVNIDRISELRKILK